MAINFNERFLIRVVMRILLKTFQKAQNPGIRVLCAMKCMRKGYEPNRLTKLSKTNAKFKTNGLKTTEQFQLNFYRSGIEQFIISVL